jgi:hypothetical protein
MGSPAGSRILVDLIAGRLSPSENRFSPDRVFEPPKDPTL